MHPSTARAILRSWKAGYKLRGIAHEYGVCVWDAYKVISDSGVNDTVIRNREVRKRKVKVPA